MGLIKCNVITPKMIVAARQLSQMLKQTITPMQVNILYSQYQTEHNTGKEPDINELVSMIKYSKEVTDSYQSVTNSSNSGTYEVSSRGDKRYSATEATFKPGTIIKGQDVGGYTIEEVYQTLLKEGTLRHFPKGVRKVQGKFLPSGFLYNPSLTTAEDREDFSYYEGYLPLWQKWARQNPELIEELRVKSAGKTLTDQFARTRVNQARALTDILQGAATSPINESIEERVESKEMLPEVGTPVYNPNALSIESENPRAKLSREMSPKEILMRESMIARDFSEVIDKEIKSIKAALEQELAEIKAIEPDNQEEKLDKLRRQLEIQERLDTINDPVKGRVEVINSLGIDKILETLKQEYQKWVDLSDSELSAVTKNPEHVREAYRKILANFDVLFDEATALIEAAEHFKLNKSYKESVSEVQESENEDSTVIEGDEEGSVARGNEGYSFKVRFLDPHSSARAETRKALSNIAQKDSKGNTVKDDLGKVVYLREDYVHAVLLATLSKDLLNPDDFSVMDNNGKYSFPALEKMANTYPWVKQIINKLKKDPKLISIFYNDFRKEFISYWTVRATSVFPINKPMDVRSTIDNLISNYEGRNLQSAVSIFDVNMNINQENVDKVLKAANVLLGDISKVSVDEDLIEKDSRGNTIPDRIVELLKALGFSSYNLNINALYSADNKGIITNIVNNAMNILNVAKQLSNEDYYPDKVSSYINNIANLIGKATELDAQTTFREQGKTYPSYASPNYIERVFKALKMDSKRAAFLAEEFKKYDWFFHNGEWFNNMLDLIENDESTRNNLEIKNVFSIDGEKYNDWNSDIISAAFLSEYFAFKEDSRNIHNYAWFPFPIFSDTEMATFVKFKKYSGPNFRRDMLPLWTKLVKQELRRIALVKLRRKKKILSISNFDKNGTKFNFLPELNTLRKVYKGKETSFLEIIEDLVAAGDTESINREIEEAVTYVLNGHVREFMSQNSNIINQESIVDMIKESTGAKDEDIPDKLAEYIWNTEFMRAQIIQVLTTDLAYYKDSVDFQKRFKEVYAAGTRLNINSKYGRKWEKTIYVKDTILTSPSYSSLSEIFKEAVKEGRISEMDYDSIMYKFRNINATDGQAFRSLKSYRAIMDMLGSWTDQMDAAFDRLTNGTWDISDFNIVWQTIKPFVFGNVETSSGITDNNGQDIKLRTPHQNKNSEFLLLATYQALGTALTTSPQARALSKFMEESDIDVIQFESAVKVGGNGIIDININPETLQEVIEEGSILGHNLPDGVTGRLSVNNISESFEVVKEYFDNLLNKGAIAQEDYNKVMNTFIPTEKQITDILHRAVHTADNELLKDPSTDVSKVVVDGYNTNTVHKISYEDYMIAQPTPEHLFDAESIFGSQFRNLIMSDLPADIEIEVEGSKIKGAEEVKKFYMSLIIENLIDSYKEVSEDFKDIESLQKSLLSLIQGNPKYSRDIQNALQIIEYKGRKTFNIPLSDRTITNQIQELILSKFKNHITKQYINGASCILVSNFGFTDKLQVVRREDGSVEAVQCYLPAYSKKMYEPFLKEVIKNGNVIGYEINYSKIKKEDESLLKFVGYRIPTEGKYSMLPLIIKGFLPQANGSSIMLPAEITTMSGSDFDVDKLFMMLPSFNISKKYNLKQLWNDFYKDPANADINEEIEAELGRKFNEFQEAYPESDLDIEDFIQAFLAQAKNQGVRKYQFSENAQKRFTEWFKEHKNDYPFTWSINRIKYDTNKEVQDNNREQRNNALIQIAYGVLTNKNVGELLQSPGNFDGIKKEGRINDIILNNYLFYQFALSKGIDLAKAQQNIGRYNQAVSKVIELLQNSTLDELNSFMKNAKVADSPLTLSTYIKYHNQNMTGGALIGIYANNTTMQAKLQGKTLYLDNDSVFEINGREIRSLTDVDTIESVNGKQIKVKISKNCAQFSAASVDNVKDPVLASLFQNRKTASITCFMLRAGFSISEIASMFSNLIVQDAIKEGFIIRTLNNSINAAIEQVKSLKRLGKINITKAKDINTAEVRANSFIMNNKEYFDTLDANTKADYLITAIMYAKNFEHIAKLAQQLNQTIQVYRADSPNGAIGNSIALAKSQTLKLEWLNTQSIIGAFNIVGIDKLLQSNYLSTNDSIDIIRKKLLDAELPMLQAFYSLGIDLGYKSISNMFVESTKFIDTIISGIQDNSKFPLNDKTIDTIYNAVTNFALSNTELFGDDPNMSLLEKKEYYLYKFPEKFRQIVKDNPDIAELPFIQKLTASDEGITMRNSARNTPYLREVLMNSADSLLYMNNPVAQELALDLFRYAYYSNNFSFSHNSFSQYFSSLFKTAFPEYVETLRDLPSTVGMSGGWNKLLDQIYANNPNLAPKIALDPDSIGDGFTITVDSEKVANSITGNAYLYINDGESCYKADPSTIDSDRVTYIKLTRPSRPLYNINGDINEMAEQLNKYTKSADKKKEDNFIVKSKARNTLSGLNNGVTESSNQQFAEMESSTIEELSLDEEFDLDEIHIEEINTLRNEDQRYDPEIGLKETNNKPCNL